jgi:hypothetical protein
MIEHFYTVLSPGGLEQLQAGIGSELALSKEHVPTAQMNKRFRALAGQSSQSHTSQQRLGSPRSANRKKKRRW